MSPLVQQVLTLAGVVVGALASYLAGTAAERGRWSREASVRWDEKRMLAYAAYATSVKTFVLLANRLSAERGIGSASQPMPLDEGLQKLAEAEAARGAAWEQVLLLGDPATIAAAREWHECAWRLEAFARGYEGDTEHWATAMAAANSARAQFYECARLDLGVADNPPVSNWPRRPVAMAASEPRK